jgi:hypothetical protein
MKPQQELDNLIDAALAGYSSTEPAPGLEARVLRRVHTAGPARWRIWDFRFAAAVSAVAALLLAAVAVRMWRHEATSPPPAPNAIAAMRPPAVTAHSPRATSSETASATRRHRVRPKGLPKGEQFPGPAPLTPEENALVAWVRRAPAEARDTLAALRTQTEAPVAIAPIEIPPIQDENAQ